MSFKEWFFRPTASDFIERSIRGDITRQEEERLTPPPDTRHHVPFYSPCYSTVPKGHFLFGGQTIPISQLRSTLFLGQSGSGKSHAMMIVTRNIAEAVAAYPDMRLFIVAAKTDAADSFRDAGIPYTTIDITDPTTPFWDLAKDYSNPDEFMSLAKVLIPTEEKNPFWSQASQGVLGSVMASLFFSFGNSWRFCDAVKGSLLPICNLERLISLCPSNRFFIDRMFRDVKEFGQTRSNVLFDVFARLRDTFPLAVHCQEARQPFSLRRFLTPGIPPEERIVILQPDLAAQAATLPMVHAIVGRLTELVSDLPEPTTRKVVLSLDEAQFLGRIRSVSKFTAFTRSKGGALLFSSQTVDGLYNEYGEHDAEAILGNFPSVALLRQGTQRSASWCVKKIGTVEVWEERVSAGVGREGFTQSSSWGWSLRSRTVDSDFYTLPLASPRHGVEGFYIVPDGTSDAPHEVYRHTIPPSIVDRYHPLPVMRLHEKRRTSGHLRPWTSKELTRALLSSASPERKRRYQELLSEEVLRGILQEVEILLQEG
jgi:hypothetical protein